MTERINKVNIFKSHRLFQQHRQRVVPVPLRNTELVNISARSIETLLLINTSVVFSYKIYRRGISLGKELLFDRGPEAVPTVWIFIISLVS